MEKVIQDFSLFGIDELDKAYKQFQFKYVDNNKLKMLHIPMRRKPFKKKSSERLFTDEAGLVHGASYCFVEHKQGKSVMENMLLKMRKDGYDEIRSQYNKFMFEELKKALENAPGSNDNAPEDSRYIYGLGATRTADHMYANSKLLALRRTANFSYMELADTELTETEIKVLRNLRHPNVIMRYSSPSIDTLSDEEIEALYNKMDAIIEHEGINRRALGDYDEMYVVELLRVKEILYKECINRQLDVSKNQNME